MRFPSLQNPALPWILSCICRRSSASCVRWRDPCCPIVKEIAHHPGDALSWTKSCSGSGGQTLHWLWKYNSGVTHFCLRRYLDDLNTVLVPELLPASPIKADNDANPGPGRRADEVGEFYFMHRWACTDSCCTMCALMAHEAGGHLVAEVKQCGTVSAIQILYSLGHGHCTLCLSLRSLLIWQLRGSSMQVPPQGRHVLLLLRFYSTR